MWGGVGAGKRGVSLQTRPSWGWGEEQRRLVNRQTVRGFKASRSRDTETPDKIKQNKTNIRTQKGRGSIGLKRCLKESIEIIMGKFRT